MKQVEGGKKATVCKTYRSPVMMSLGGYAQFVQTGNKGSADREGQGGGGGRIYELGRTVDHF